MRRDRDAAIVSDAFTVEPLRRPVGAVDQRALARLLVDAVDSGAAVSFLAPLSEERALAWWRATLETSPERSVFLVARDSSGIAGTVQMHPAWAPNQPHRAEIAKLIVDRRHRRTGLGTRLMQGIEEEARRAGLSLLTLDARRGGDAERLYRRLGWTVVGIIPGYALDADGCGRHDTVVFYKPIDSGGR
jgi:ribosomal protein S18 acetylase RimI-like enzyme